MHPNPPPPHLDNHQTDCAEAQSSGFFKTSLYWDCCFSLPIVILWEVWNVYCMSSVLYSLPKYYFHLCNALHDTSWCQQQTYYLIATLKSITPTYKWGHLYKFVLVRSLLLTSDALHTLLITVTVVRMLYSFIYHHSILHILISYPEINKY